jgi:hypothetical protein
MTDLALELQKIGGRVDWGLEYLQAWWPSRPSSGKPEWSIGRFTLGTMTIFNPNFMTLVVKFSLKN